MSDSTNIPSRLTVSIILTRYNLHMWVGDRERDEAARSEDHETRSKVCPSTIGRMAPSEMYIRDSESSVIRRYVQVWKKCRRVSGEGKRDRPSKRGSNGSRWYQVQCSKRSAPNASP